MAGFTIFDYQSIYFKPAKNIYPSAWLEHIPFAYFLIEYLSPEIVVELGVHNGSSYTAFCEASKKLNKPTKCFGVDTWVGEEHAGFYPEDIYNELYAHHKESFPEISTLLRCTFDEALDKISDKSVSLLHIDGLHTYEAVKHDFDTWLPKVKEGGVILFHDTQERQRDFGVWKLWEELSGKYQSFEFTHCHGLGVILVGSNSKMEVFLREINQNKLLQNTFCILGQNISDRSYYDNHIAFQAKENLKNTEKLMKDFQVEKDGLKLEIHNLHVKADSMRLKNRVKRLFKL